MTRALFMLAALAACRVPAPRTAVSRPRGEVTSNILRTDYAGSAACKRCHEDLYAEWMRAPMHRMTREAPAAEIAAPFDGSIFTLKDDRAVTFSEGGERYVRVESARFGNHLYRVTKVIGGHHREDFAGVEVEQPGGRVIGNPRDERVLPISYMIDARALRYKGYSVMVTERPGLKVGGVWNRTCIFCHNTVPYLSTMLGELDRAAPAYQGEVVDARLPRDRQARVQVLDPAGLARALADEIAFLGGRVAGDRGPTAAEAIRQTRGRFNARHLVEVGIGCESCHGGSRAHVDNFHLKPALGPRSPLLRVVLPRDSRPAEINRMCARCHQVLFSRYPHTWEGGSRRGPSDQLGGSNINSGEARDFLLGGCASAMSCVDCHDPHAHDNREKMASLDGTAVCMRCHAAVKEHSHHSQAVSCIDCHMPRKNMSLENELTRYHRIGSPTDRARVENDRPIECALCHADQTVRWMLDAMTRWWGKSYDRERLAALYGSIDADVLRATLARGKPHEQAIAIDLLGRTKTIAAKSAIDAESANAYPIVRFYVLKALERITGQPAKLDPNGSAAATAPFESEEE